MRDCRHAIRQLRQSPAFAATAILTLTLGIGANTAIFSVVNSLRLRPLPVQDPDRLAVLGDAVREGMSWSHPVWEQIRSKPELFEGTFASSAERLNLARGGEAQFAEGLFTFVVAATILVAVGALASWLPAWRASRIDPVAALRQ